MAFPNIGTGITDAALKKVGSEIQKQLSESKNKKSDFYETPTESWYKNLPYAFIIPADKENSNRIFFLPINPSGLSITTYFATNVTTTLYGIVEEHSEQRVFDITIQGTTGIVARNCEEVSQDKAKDAKSTVRQSYIVDSTLNISTKDTGGFFARTIGRAQQAANQATDAIKTAMGKTNPHKSGVDPKNSGYLAFHNFYKFLLSYKKNMSKRGKNGGIPLIFRNYKDNNEYSCVLQSFTLERNSNDPMLYSYNIRMRAYDIRTAASTSEAKDLTNRTKELGLDSNPSLYTTARQTIAKTRGALNSAISAAKSTIGR